jgi:predicted  nucleic acid-binding Zn-ribbon protein
MLYFFVGIIFIHKISANEDALNKIFPTDNHTKIITSWFIGRLVSELVYKTLDANNRNVHSFLRAMRNVNRGMGYILFVMLLIGIFSAMSTLWLVYGAVITFGQAFIFNMTLPIGWIRSLIILWSVGVASLISGAVMVLYNFIMIFYIPFNYSGNLKDLCGVTENPRIMNVVYSYGLTLVYLSVMGILYITTLINFGSGYNYTPILFKSIMLLITIVFYFTDMNIDYTGKKTDVKCQSKKTGGETDDKFNNNDIFNAILSGDQGYVPKEKLDELSKDFTRFLYTKLLESKMAESGILPPKEQRELAAAENSAELLTKEIDELEEKIKSVRQQIKGMEGSLDDNFDKVGKGLDIESIAKLKLDLSNYQNTKEIKVESLSRAKTTIDSISRNKPAKKPDDTSPDGNTGSHSASPPEDNGEVVTDDVATNSPENLTKEIDELQKKITRVQKEIDQLEGPLNDDKLDVGTRAVYNSRMDEFKANLSNYKKEIKSALLYKAKTGIDPSSTKTPDVASVDTPPVGEVGGQVGETPGGETPGDEGGDSGDTKASTTVSSDSNKEGL